MESESSEWTPMSVSIATGLNRLPVGKSRDLRVPVPADGQIRRIVLHWAPTPRQVPAFLRGLQNLWWRQVKLKSSSFAELRSAELVATPGTGTWVDLAVVTRDLHSNDIPPIVTERPNPFLGSGLSYKVDRKR
ncbi:MAG: hypothetical protein JWM68_4126 [Verrucomicrobiales bacterium]|nr:hypothetical protein [Verrucomicrobiales bacterium]